MQFRQEAPGRYVGEFAADKAGSYLLAINTGQGNAAPLLTGVTVPYSAEFRERETNEALLTTLASYQAQGWRGGQGDRRRTAAKGTIDRLVAVGRYVPPHAGQGDQQPGFLADLPADGRGRLPGRRVRPPRHRPLRLGRAGRWLYAYNRVRGRQQDAAPRRAAGTAAQPQGRRVATRSTSAAPPPASSRKSDELHGAADYEQVIARRCRRRRCTRAAAAAAADPSGRRRRAEQETYTERLLAAKKKAKKQQDRHRVDRSRQLGTTQARSQRLRIRVMHLACRIAPTSSPH